jgi:hypothetical protein
MLPSVDVPNIPANTMIGQTMGHTMANGHGGGAGGPLISAPIGMPISMPAPRVCKINQRRMEWELMKIKARRWR